MNTVSFYAVARRSFSVPFRFPFVWIWGGLFAIVYVIGRVSLPSLPNLSDPENIIRALTDTDALLAFAGWNILAAIVHLLGKSGFILTLHRQHQKKTLPDAPSRNLPPLRSLIRGFFQTIGIESAALLFLGLCVAIILLPVAVARWYNPDALSSVSLLSLVALLLLLVTYSFVKEYALLYRLLSKLSFRSAFETGSVLFTRRLGPSLAFGIMLVVITTIFTFLLNLVILGDTALEQFIGFSGSSILGVHPLSFIAAAWMGIVYQSLWYYFFLALASPHNTKKAVKSEAVTIENGVPQLPPASSQNG